MGTGKATGERWRLSLAVTAVSAVSILTVIAGCSAGDGEDEAQAIADRFVEQVNTGTCDDPSGFGKDEPTWDEPTWASACWAAVADLAAGTSLGTPELRSFSSGEVQTHYSLTVPYRDVYDVPAKLRLSFDGEGFFATSATLTRISSNAAASVGQLDLFGYGGAGDPAEADARALVDEVESLLLAGRCDEIGRLAAPSSEFPEAGRFDECAALVTLAAASPPDRSHSYWSSNVYSTYDLYAGSEEAYGIPRREGEDPFDYGQRVVDAIGDTNREVSLRSDNPQFSIVVVLYEQKWYLLSIEYATARFAFDF